MSANQPVSTSAVPTDLAVEDFFPQSHVIDPKVLEKVYDDRPDPRVRKAVSTTFRVLGLFLRR